MNVAVLIARRLANKNLEPERREIHIWDTDNSGSTEAAGRELECRESSNVLASKRCAPAGANFGLINVQFAKRCIEHVPVPKEKALAIESGRAILRR